MTVAVSIIMPVYNVEKYLKKTLESVEAQSFQNYELIAINDGSTDKSFEILKMYQDRMPQLYIMDQKNSGVSTARNRGIKRATGEYVCFLDADDQLSPDYLEHMYKIAVEKRQIWWYAIMYLFASHLFLKSIVKSPYLYKAQKILSRQEC